MYYCELCEIFQNKYFRCGSWQLLFNPFHVAGLFLCPKGFLMLAGGIEKDQLHEMSQRTLKMIKSDIETRNTLVIQEMKNFGNIVEAASGGVL